MAPCSPAAELPIELLVVLVNRGDVHYNRNRWSRGPTGGTLLIPGASTKRGEFVEEPLKHLMQELGNAINDSLSESDRIAEAIGEIKRAGYDVFLVLEATIGFNRRDENSEEEEEEHSEVTEEPKRTFETTGKIKLTSQDQRFLRALKIAVDEENR
jgi:hypothetical protein